MDVSVIIPTYNPSQDRLRRVLSALKSQTLSANRWETLIVDNASHPPLSPDFLPEEQPLNLRLIHEPQPGLTHARKRGILETSGQWCVLVDDDNVLAPDYLEQTLAFFTTHPNVGMLGGKVLPEFETEPAAWQKEFFPLLALRDLGDAPILSGALAKTKKGTVAYPECAPIGAGMALRRKAALIWAEKTSQLSDRKGNNLTSGGDNDIVLTLMEHGWEAAYSPDLKLTHLIPASRLQPDYLARLNHGIQKSWTQVLLQHNASPWPSIPAWSIPLRKLRAWFSYRAWSSDSAYIRWQGACGHFEGRIRT